VTTLGLECYLNTVFQNNDTERRTHARFDGANTARASMLLSFGTTTTATSSTTFRGVAARGTTTKSASSQHFYRNELGIDARRPRRVGDGCARARCDAAVVRCKMASEGVERRALVRGVGRRRRDAGRRRSTHESGQESSFFVDTPKTMRERIVDICDKGTSYFPAFVAVGAVLGLAAPATVSWFRGDAVTYALAVTMLGMGITLDFKDFKGVLSTPWKILMGVSLQYTIMPTLAFLVGKLFLSNSSLAAGLILVGCCPGGTASNVVTYLAGASVPLSVVLTTVSTFMATIMTPMLTQQLAGTIVPVDGFGLFLSTCKVVLLPVITGLLLKKYAPKLSREIEPFAPVIAVLTVALICSSIIGRTSAQILAAGPTLIGSVALLHSMGFSLGYALSRWAGFSTKTSRTMSIEVGMQNSALGVVLASAHFGDPLVAVPCAISATVHSVLGSGLAGMWRYRDTTKDERRRKELEAWYNDPNYTAYNDAFKQTTGLSSL
jgi:BASS family bile acid:Na+ symporter